MLTFASLPSRSGTSSDTTMAPKLVIFRTTPLALVRVYKSTSTPSAVFPNADFSMLIFGLLSGAEGSLAGTSLVAGSAETAAAVSDWAPPASGWSAVVTLPPEPLGGGVWF